MKTLPAVFLLAFLFALSPIVSAQTNDTGLSGSLETSHQTYFYKDPNKALLLAFFPGLLLHGYGHFYAGDNLMGATLLTGEIISVVSIGLGAVMQSDPDSFSGGIFGSSTSAQSLGKDFIIGGAIAFGALWIIDMAHAPTAAKEYDDDHGLKPMAFLEDNRPTLALAYRF